MDPAERGPRDRLDRAGQDATQVLKTSGSRSRVSERPGGSTLAVASGSVASAAARTVASTPMGSTSTRRRAKRRA